jgi:hypothetical protein
LNCSHTTRTSARRYDAKHFEGPVRRVLMKKTERHVYYGRLGDEMTILAVWGARRGRGPKL